MRRTLLALLAVASASAPGVAQSNETLEQVAEGFGRGECSILTHQALDPETRTWATIDPSPWAGWAIERVGPRTLEYVRPDGVIRHMEFEEGVYRDRAPDTLEGAEEWTILEHGISASDNWRILMKPAAPNAPPVYSEMIVAGDVFVWTNWADEPDGSRIRFMYVVCQFVGG